MLRLSFRESTIAPFPGRLYHRRATADKIGEVFDARPELDVALVSVTLAASDNFTNDCYFQAQPLRMLLEGEQIMEGSWSEMDGMSSGLVSILAYGLKVKEPTRPYGHPPVDFREWHPSTLGSVFEVINKTVSEGVCGAPIVNCETAGVRGFFHLFDGTNCLIVHLDDLVAEG